MKEGPIIFKTEMIKATLENRKTQMRRVIKPQPIPEPARFNYWGENWTNGKGWMPESNSGKVGIFSPSSYKCPYGIVGDKLWVRETHNIRIVPDFQTPERMLELGYNWDKVVNRNGEDKYIYYRASGERNFVNKWTPSIFMPRWASRINLEITNIRVERLQDINQNDIIDEGIWYWSNEYRNEVSTWRDCESALKKIRLKYFKKLWDSIGKNRGYGWDKNPWVFVITFKTI